MKQLGRGKLVQSPAPFLRPTRVSDEIPRRPEFLSYVMNTHAHRRLPSTTFNTDNSIHVSASNFHLHDVEYRAVHRG